MSKKITDSIVEDAFKFTFLVKEFPKSDLLHITQMMSMPGIDVNLAIWQAIADGWVIDPATNEPGDEYIHLGEIQPEKWEFGTAIAELEEKLLLAFKSLAERETDLQWEFLSQWLVGYAARDVMIVLKKMLADGTLEKYYVADPEDEESVYEFYTLPENRKNLWGGKSFKTQPLVESPEPQDEINDEADASESEE